MRTLLTLLLLSLLASCGKSAGEEAHEAGVELMKALNEGSQTGEFDMETLKAAALNAQEAGLSPPKGIELTDDLIERWVAMSIEVLETHGTATYNQGNRAEYEAGRTAIRKRHGLSEIEELLLTGRMMAAQMALKMEEYQPIPEELAADVALYKKHRTALEKVDELRGELLKQQR